MNARFHIAGVLLVTLCAAIGLTQTAWAAPARLDDIGSRLMPHRAVYDVSLVSVKSGSQVLNIRGKMGYEWRRSCGAWQTDHSFKLIYDYADAPSMAVQSDFATFESEDGLSFDFSTRRRRDGELFEDILGQASIDPVTQAGKAILRQPEKMERDLPKGSLFPSHHTMNLIAHALAGDKFFSANVYDGTDTQGPVEISSVIIRPADPAALAARKDVTASLVKDVPGWHVRMSFFPEGTEQSSDYEMSMDIFQNGLIGDMLIEYDDFSVRQTLVKASALDEQPCGAPAANPEG